MGAPHFSARKAAGCSLDDIAEAVNLAHCYDAKVFVALNTLLFDNELSEACKLANELYTIGVDALIIQDYALLSFPNMPPIELHSSTQMDNRTLERVRFHESQGFKQIVLARELSEAEIANIANNTNVRLEAFIHGALCVSYSGRCFMSQAICGRSANRGECSQPCRLPYSLYDREGSPMARNQYLLSLKDFNQTQNIERLIDAGVSSFKIEGRLKDANYVANVTAHYRQVIDNVLQRRTDLKRASRGVTICGFTPDVSRSFNRGFTTYFFNGRQDKIHNPISPKSMGQPLGLAIHCTKNSFSINSNIKISNNDGLCFVNKDSLVGLKVNKVDNNVIYPLRMNGLHNGSMLFRNSDVEMEQTLKTNRTQRKIDISFFVTLNLNGDIVIDVTDDRYTCSSSISRANLTMTTDPHKALQTAIQQLSKTGGTIFQCKDVSITPEATIYFIPTSLWNEQRRQLLDSLINLIINGNRPVDTPLVADTRYKYPQNIASADIGIVNSYAKEFLENHDCRTIETGYERLKEYAGRRVMTTRHCLLFSMGKCLKKHPEMHKKMPLTLIDEEHGNKYIITTECDKCQMAISLMQQKKYSIVKEL